MKTLIEKHEKAIGLLKTIKTLNEHISQTEHQCSILKADNRMYSVKFYEKIIASDVAIKNRLQNDYNKSFKI